jgi:hypothetical protein
MSEVAEDFSHIIHILTTLTSSNIFGFGGCKGHTVLTARLPRDSAAVEHNNVTRMGAARINIGCPV